MRKPELSHYPKWLREMIVEPIASQIRGISSNREVDDSLRKIYTNYRVDPISNIVFDLTIEIIRTRFRLYHMQKKMDSLQDQIDELKEKK